MVEIRGSIESIQSSVKKYIEIKRRGINEDIKLDIDREPSSNGSHFYPNMEFDEYYPSDNEVYVTDEYEVEDEISPLEFQKYLDFTVGSKSETKNTDIDIEKNNIGMNRCYVENDYTDSVKENVVSEIENIELEDDDFIDYSSLDEEKVLIEEEISSAISYDKYEDDNWGNWGTSCEDDEEEYIGDTDSDDWNYEEDEEQVNEIVEEEDDDFIDYNNLAVEKDEEQVNSVEEDDDFIDYSGWSSEEEDVDFVDSSNFRSAPVTEEWGIEDYEDIDNTVVTNTVEEEDIRGTGDAWSTDLDLGSSEEVVEKDIKWDLSFSKDKKVVNETNEDDIVWDLSFSKDEVLEEGTKDNLVDFAKEKIEDVSNLVKQNLENEEIVVVNEELKEEYVPKDLRDFIKLHNNCEMSFALKYFSKKEIDKQLNLGRVFKRKNRLLI